MTGFFDGLVVIELADRRNQYVGKLLADGGARVMQIEPPSGSAGRQCGPFVHDRTDPDASLDYWYYNAGKQSVCADIAVPEGADIVRSLIDGADVFIESCLGESLAPYKLDYASLRLQNPRLIQASLTDFGQDGPWRDYLANDVSHLALGGPMGSSGYSDPTVEPIGGQGHQAWNIAGTLTAHAIIAALIERLDSGEGQYIDSSIHDCTAISTEVAFPEWVYNERVLYRHTGQHASASSTAGKMNLEAADGRLVNIIATELTPYLWANMLMWLEEQGEAGELSDPKYLDDVYRAIRWREGTEIKEALGRLIGKTNSYDAMLRAQSFGLTWSVVQAPEENYSMDQWKDRESFKEIPQPGLSKPVRFPRGPFLVSDNPFEPRGPSPKLGEHTDVVLTELLGMDRTSIDVLRSSGAVR